METFLNFSNQLWSQLLWLVDQLMGTLPSLIRANRTLARKITSTLHEDYSDDPRLELPESDLMSEFQFDLNRLARIEDKARSTVIGVALSISVASPGVLLLVQSDVFADEASYLRTFAAIVLISAISFLLTSGYLALTGYRAGQVFQPRLRDHPQIISKDKARLLIVRCIDLNVYRILQRANLLSGSIDCLRNGIALVMLFLMLAVIAAI